MSQSPEVKFEKLTPISNSDLGVYEAALDFIFENDDIKNVAISGAYGAGKSSVLASYKEKHKGKKYIHISLAHFTEYEEAASQDDKKKENVIKESVLEGKILNQLIHQIPADKIPQSHFRVKKTLNKNNIFIISLATTLSILFLIIFISFKKWVGFVDSLRWEPLKNILQYTTFNESRLVIGMAILLLSVFWIYKIVEIQKSRNIFRKLNVQGNEIEIFEDSDESYFDKYLNEVLYLFENVDADVIVFEDMDRYDANQIFERLREVNTLANLQRKIDKKEILRFFYLLRDDIFISKDRTKFFDYIIPIVPVVDSSNSYDQFISHLKRLDIYCKFDEHFLQGLSLYVDDMRLLKNICNEFLVYYKRLNTTELDCNKMLAIMTYKNLFPKDYSDLQLNKGFVHAIFSHKEEFISSEKQVIAKTISENTEKIEAIKNETLQSIDELNVITETKRNRARGGYGSDHQAWQKWEKELPHRKSLIEQKDNGRIEELQKEIEKLQNELLLLNNSPIWKIITRKNIDVIFSTSFKNEIGETEDYKEIRRSDYFALLKFLIRNGYIDESYQDYMTYFYENSLSRNDKIFLRSVTDKKAKEYSYPLKNPQIILDRLDLWDFDQEETLNFSLIDYLLKNKMDKHLSHFIEQVKATSNLDFISQYLNVTQQMEKLIILLNSKWPELFSLLLNNNALTNEEIKQYSVYTLYYCNDESISKVNTGGVLANFIISSPDYLDIQRPEIDRILHGFSILDIYFPAIDYESSNKMLFHAVYDAGYYEINIYNIKLILKKIYNVDNDDDIVHKTTTLIKSNPDSPLTKKIESDMVTYIVTILENSESLINDDESVAISILNDTTISFDDKRKYIAALTTQINRIDGINEKQLWPLLVSSKVAAFNVHNIINYFVSRKMDDTLIEFINGGTEVLDFSHLEGSLEDYKDSLFDEIVKCNLLDNTKYETMLCNLNCTYQKFSFTGISDDKMHILIDNKIIEMNENILLFIRENYPSLVYYFIEQNFDVYYDLMDGTLFSLEELLFILKLKVDEDKKIGLLELSTQEISIREKEYSDHIYEYILHHNYDPQDFTHIVKHYSHYGSIVQNAIYSIAINSIEELVSIPEIVDENLIKRIMESADIANRSKVDLLLSIIPYLDKDSVCCYLEKAKKAEFAKIFDPRSRPRFERSDENQSLLNAFIEKGWISDSYVDSDGYLRARKQEMRKNGK